MQSNNDVLIVDARHNGPPGSGNGGWTAGLIAAHLRHTVPEVTLLKPPPLDTPLNVLPTEEGLRVTSPDDTVVATARRRADDIVAVAAASYEEALAATNRYPGHGRHHFPTCFVCGPQRPDGLRIFPGRLDDGRTAAIFTTPHAIDPVMVWAALDCPGGWTVIEGDLPWVLGRFAVALDDLPTAGEECVVVGEAVRREGRKAMVRTTLYAPDQQVLARGEVTWIQLPPPAGVA